MPQFRRPVRLLLRRARKGHRATWVIKDHRLEVATGCWVHDRQGAELMLALYLAGKYWSTGAMQSFREQADETQTPTDVRP